VEVVGSTVVSAVVVAGSTVGKPARYSIIQLVPEESLVTLALLPPAPAASHAGGPFFVIVKSREEFSHWLNHPHPDLVGIQVEDLMGDPEVWALAAQGPRETPLDVILKDPATEFSALYRLADVRLVRPVRVTIPAMPGLRKALRLAASLQLPVRILPGQPDAETLLELTAAADFYLRDPMVDAPLEPFHSVFAALRGMTEGNLWEFLDEDPSLCSKHDEAGQPFQAPDFVQSHFADLLQQGGECTTCPWQELCAGYFKWPDPTYDCHGVKSLFNLLESAAREITHDLATLSPATPSRP
jgi:hypothetical protein